MSEALNTVIETGGDFITRSASGGTITTGVTGTILTLTPPAGQRVRLTHLSTAAATNQTGISVIIGSNIIINELDLDGDSPTSTVKFSVGNYQPYGAVGVPAGNYQSFTGQTGEVLTILKNTGTTVATTYYGYEFGL